MATGLILSGLAWSQSVEAGQTIGLPDYSRESEVIYGRKLGLALTMEIFTPVEQNGLGIVWVVGGGGISSREQTLRASFERRVSPLLAGGYVVFAVVHGSGPRFQLQDHVADVRRAVRFIRHHASDYGIDSELLGISGSSSGGYVALMVALHTEGGEAAAEDPVDRESERVQAAGCFFSPTDLVAFGEGSETVLDFFTRRFGVVDPSFRFYEVDERTGARTILTEPDDVLNALRQMSPVTHVSPDDPPTILIHGNQDTVVPFQQSERLLDRFEDASVVARLVVREGKDHAWADWESDAALLAEWFDKHLALTQ